MGKEENISSDHALIQLHDVEFPGTDNGFRAAFHLKLAVDYIDIPFHCTYSNHQPLRDFTIGVACDD